ncbi:MAG TPA: VCBS repeat-containing protein, partial [Vicinamibacterales bacterium]|nr:VCBS repeat-containing protein [Vicinamibacterales bacterium]
MTPHRGAVLLMCALLVWGAGAACRQTPEASAGAGSGPPWFEDIAARAGIEFVYRSGHETKHYLPEIMGGGAALFDIDNDGLLDIYLVQAGSLLHESAGTGNRLYRNRGDGTF